MRARRPRSGPAPASAGFNNHHLSEKPCQVEGLSLGRETLHYCCVRPAAPHYANSALHSSPVSSGLPARRRDAVFGRQTSSPDRRSRSQLTLLVFLDDTTRKFRAGELFPTEDAQGRSITQNNGWHITWETLAVKLYRSHRGTEYHHPTRAHRRIACILAGALMSNVT